MYKYDLIFTIFSSDNTLESIIKEVKSNDKFTYKFKNYPSLDIAALKNSDVVIWDINDNILDYQDFLKKNAKVILLTDKFDNKYGLCSKVIVKPYEKEYLVHSVDNIIKLIELEEDLTFNKICLTTAIDSMPDMFWIKTLDGIHTVLNQEFCNVVKKSRADVTGKDHYYIWNVSKDDPNSGADVCKKTEDEVIKAGHLLNFLETVKIDEGIRELITYKAPLYDKLGNPVGTVGIGHDVTDLKNLSMEISVLLNSMPYPVLLRDNNKKITTVNPAFLKVFGVNKNDVIGVSYDDWAKNTFHEGRITNSEGFTEANLTVAGEEKTVELRFDDIRDVFDNVTGQVCIFRDVTTQRKLEEQIIKNSNIDFMTKLYNRRYLDKFISEQGEGATLTLISIDLDHFKSVNDTYGHKAGDEAIILTANTLTKTFPEDIVVRMGGDEFLVVKVGSYSLEDVQKEAQTVLDNLIMAFNTRDEFKKLSASIGVSQDSLENSSIDILLNNADNAMYESKEKGRACYTIFKN